MASILSVVVCAFILLLPVTSSSADLPNIVVISSDDYAWPYYGFMQRYLRARQGLPAGDPYALGEAYRADPTISASRPADRHQLILPDDRYSSTPFVGECGIGGADEQGCQRCEGTCSQSGAPCTQHAECPGGTCQPGPTCTAPLHKVLTPALDSLARAGIFYPGGHASGSRCQPTLVTMMTGLHLKDVRPGPDPSSTTVSPVLPEWLPGFRWDGEKISCQALPPTYYLTIGAGKWQYNIPHRFPSGSVRHPFDREIDAAGEGPQARELLTNRLQDVKDFVDCAACVRRCAKDPGQRVCQSDADCAGAGPCTLVGCRAPQGSRTAPDSCRLAGRGSACQAQPFFAFYNPFMPHLDYQPTRLRPVFDRTPEVCAKEPYRSFSAYCRASGDLFADGVDPHLDANGNGVADPEEARSGAQFDEILKRIARNTNHTPDIYLGSADLENFSSKAEFLRWINTFDRTVDELVVHLRESGLLENTVIVYLTDNGFGLTSSKTFFSEHGYRTPIVVWDPRAAASGGTRPGCTDAGGNAIPGCRNEFAHAVDVLATVRSAAGCLDDPASCPIPSPMPARGQQAYMGQDLSRPDGVDRACRFTGDARLGQCLFGMRKGDQGIAPYKGWYVLAEARETASAGSRHHLCKLYRQCAAPSRRLHDLIDDPNERKNLLAPADGSFCAGLAQELERVLWKNVDANGWGDACFPPP